MPTFPLECVKDVTDVFDLHGRATTGQPGSSCHSASLHDAHGELALLGEEIAPAVGSSTSLEVL